MVNRDGVAVMQLQPWDRTRRPAIMADRAYAAWASGAS